MRTLILGAALLISTAASAVAEPRQGLATVECKVGKDRRLTACRVLSETPKGAGVGDFALRLVSAYRIPPQDRRIKDGKVVIPLQFKMPG